MTTSRASGSEPFGEPPPSLRLIAEVAGLEAAAQLARDYGGRKIYIGARLHADHALVRSVGMEAASLILDAVGPGVLLIPLWVASRDGKLIARIGELGAQGLPSAEIARKLGCHIRTVNRHRHRRLDPTLNHPASSAQMDMFETLDAARTPCVSKDFSED